MIPMIEPTLFTDEQQQRRTAFCEICGGVCYWPGYFCLRCERRQL